MRLVISHALGLRGRVSRSPWRAHSHFDGDLQSRLVDCVWDVDVGLLGECVVML